MSRHIAAIGKHGVFAVQGAASQAFPPEAEATKHSIKFGGSLGPAWSGAFILASMGDSVAWMGSTDVDWTGSKVAPDGSLSAHGWQGITFAYKIQDAGIDNDRSDPHFGGGMKEAFTTMITTSAIHDELTTMVPLSAMPIMLNGRTFVRMSLEKEELGTGTLFSLKEQKNAQVINRRFGPGTHTVPVKVAAGPTYALRMSIGEREIVLKSFAAN